MRMFAIAMGLALPSGLQAQETGGSFQALTVSGSAPAACIAQRPSVGSTRNASFEATGTASGQITLTQLVDPQTALPRASAAALVLPVVCNASHRVSVMSNQGGLRRGGAQADVGAASGFAEFVPYTIRLNWAGVQREHGSDAGVMAIDAANGVSGELSLEVTTPEGGTPLVAGQYDDAIVIQFQPAN